MKDARTPLEKFAWEKVGPPLYYCADCKKQVIVKTIDGQVNIRRLCGCENSEIIAPRSAIVSGTGYAGLNVSDKIRVTFRMMMAKLTGRCV